MTEHETFVFTEAERAAIERSFEDFKAGRTLSLDEAEAQSAAFLESLRNKGRASAADAPTGDVTPPTRR